MPPSTPNAVVGAVPSRRIRINPKVLRAGGFASVKKRLDVLSFSQTRFSSPNAPRTLRLLSGSASTQSPSMEYTARRSWGSKRRGPRGNRGVGFQELILVPLEGFEALAPARQGRKFSLGGLTPLFERVELRPQLVQCHGVGCEHFLVFVPLTLNF